ncbi:MAG: peptidoglycan-binding protein [Thermonemataceae bacterium]
MKRIITFLVVVSLLLIAFFQYQQYRRFHPPKAYDYATDIQKIDVNYHDAALVEAYFEKAYEIGSFARQAWFNHRIDVRFPDESDTHSMQAAHRYKQLVAHVQHMEAKLKQSLRLKQQGFDNIAIALIEKKGISPKAYKFVKYFKDTTLQVGDENASVWALQQLLNQKGDTIRIDGVYSDDTEAAVRVFQKKNGLYPSGIADETTLQTLLQ